MDRWLTAIVSNNSNMPMAKKVVKNKPAAACSGWIVGTIAFRSPTQSSSGLKRIFPNGVCDWTRRGAGQTDVVPWASFGPSPDNLVFDVTRRSNRDDDDD